MVPSSRRRTRSYNSVFFDVYKKVKMAVVARIFIGVRQIDAVYILFDRSSSNLVGMSQILTTTSPPCQNSVQLSELNVVDAAILDFEDLLPFLYYLTDPHQTWWECHKCNPQRNPVVKNWFSCQNSIWRQTPSWISKNCFRFNNI